MEKGYRKVDCYPYLLCRVGTLPYHLLESIRWSKEKQSREYLELQNKKRELEKQIPIAADALSGIKKEIKQKEADFEQAFLEQQLLNRAAFTAISGHTVLQKGLLQSSPSLWQGVQRYRLQSPQIYRKKERQTERSLAQYLARICTKTSPFSTFTALSLNDLTGASLCGDSGKMTTKVRINNYILFQVQELLVGYPPVYRQLCVKVNPTLVKEQSEYIFLLNSRNVESVQRIEQNEIIGLVLECLRSQTRAGLLFENLLHDLVEQVAAEEDQLEAYLIELLRFGLLIVEWPMSGTDTNWNDALIEWLRKLNAFEGKSMLLETVSLLQKNAQLLPETEGEKRWFLLQESMTRLTTCFKKLASYIPTSNQPSLDAFVTFQRTDLALSPERLYFEDSQLSTEMEWPKKALLTCVQSLAELCDIMHVFRLRPLKEELFDFFRKNYSDTAEVSLLTFYEAFYQQKTKVTPEGVKKVLALRQLFLKKIEEHIKLDVEFDVHLPLSDLRMIMASLKLKTADTTSRNTYGALLQLHQSKGLYKSYIDAVFTGYGKMLGRFLHLFPEQYTSHLSDWVTQIQGDALWVDNTDASFHNANAHPPILNKTFAIPGGQHNLPADQQIQLRDLTILFSESDQNLQLKHKEQVLTVFDFGLEALNSRSPMYRLLSTFSVSQPDLSFLKTMLVKITQQKEGSWVRLPRVTIDQVLVLQRKAWFLPCSELPLRQRTESEAAYYLRINGWRISHGLPETVFITTEPAEEEKKIDQVSLTKEGDGYKPQYIDFKTPALVSHFSRELKKVKNMLKIEEMLPSGKEMLDVNGKKRVTEFVVQWEGV